MNINAARIRRCSIWVSHWKGLFNISTSAAILLCYVSWTHLPSSCDLQRYPVCFVLAVLRPFSVFHRFCLFLSLFIFSLLSNLCFRFVFVSCLFPVCFLDFFNYYFSFFSTCQVSSRYTYFQFLFSKITQCNFSVRLTNRWSRKKALREPSLGLV